MAFCPNCGAQIDDSAKFCNFCGAKMDAAPVRSVPEPPITEPMPAAPEIPEAPELPAEPVVSVEPGAEPAPGEAAQSIPPEPVFTEAAPQPVYTEPASQPIYAQPIYSEPPKKKSKKWLIPVIILAALALIGVAVLALRGIGGRAASNDPNLGTYKATSVSMYGIDLDPDEIFEGGFILELQSGGKCRIKAGDTSGYGTWKLEDGVLTVDDSSSTIEGKLEDGVITIENMLDMGLNITLEKQEDE